MNIRCEIANLVVDVPAAGDMLFRCREYIQKEVKPCETTIFINENSYRLALYSNLSLEQSIYMESGSQFYLKLIMHNGMMLHSSAVEVDGVAYLFSGPCGRGKSTHTKLWQQVFGEKAIVFNDDKPALRRMEDGWYAYGTPWCGKDGINQNRKVKLGGICFLVQAQENKIRRLEPKEAMGLVLSQTTHKLKNPEKMMKLLGLVDKLITEIPIYELENRPEVEAAMLSYETMHRGAEENLK